MAISFTDFVSSVLASFPLALTTLLTLGVILVNGWTDAPNAIATAVSTRSIGIKTAVLMASAMNFLGVVAMTSINRKVAVTIMRMVDFDGSKNESLLALCAAMVAIVVWASAASVLGIPTSESHALIAGLSGAAIALHGSLEGINPSEWAKVIYGLILSSFLGFGLGYAVCASIKLFFHRLHRRRAESAFAKLQVLAAAGTAFMHGAQDGQKFIGVFMLGLSLTASGTEISTEYAIPLWLMLLCSIVMGMGTSIGGARIIKSVGMDMVKMQTYEGFSADLAGGLSLLVASVFGLPVSTTHTKTTAIMGVGAAKRISNVNWLVVRDMSLAWILTFPGCGLIGYIMAKCFLAIF